MADCLGVLAELNWTELAQIAASAFKSLSNAKSTIIQIYDAQLCSHTFPGPPPLPRGPRFRPFRGINKGKLGTCVQLSGRWLVMEYVNLVASEQGKRSVKIL